jgi:ribosomal protein S18 acetylase RimI-like enzyme
MSYVIDDPATGLAQPCERILRSLPDWFGIEQAIVDYVRAIDQLPTFLARDSSGQAIGFMSVKQHFPLTAELYVLGILAEHHRRGVGRMLLDAVEAWLGRDGVRLLQVKTLSPARTSAAYDATRRYYEAMGFMPLEEFPTLWGERNPCLMMAKILR